MHLVIVLDWKEETDAFVQQIADILGSIAYEVRQRMICGAPTVIGKYAGFDEAVNLKQKLRGIGIKTMHIDTEKVRGRTGSIVVRRFELKDASIQIETRDNRRADIPYQKITALFPSTCNTSWAETKTTTEKKFSVGKTLLMGGIPMSKKVEKKELISGEKINKVLYLYVTQHMQPIIFSQNDITFEGLGDKMKTSRDQNFLSLLNELQNHCPSAIYDDRLLRRVGLTRILGPTLNPETNYDLAIEILLRHLRPVNTA